MRSCNFLVWSVLSAGLSLLASASTARAADTFTVDPVHSSMLFRVKHLNAGHIYGRFNQYSGSFAFDDKNPADCKLEMEVKIDSIDSANGDRDKHLKGPDFFNAKEFPTMTFKATRMKASDEKNYEVTGDLTIHGVTKPVTVKLERIGTVRDLKSGKPRTGWETTFTINRSDFGMKGLVPAISDEVRIIVAIEGIQ
ncbi:MAG TPA: YceI family protein [Gemmataceae bacterium]|nr:YceI family protein [Gemmataceae bacterium]